MRLRLFHFVSVILFVSNLFHLRARPESIFPTIVCAVLLAVSVLLFIRTGNGKLALLETFPGIIAAFAVRMVLSGRPGSMFALVIILALFLLIFRRFGLWKRSLYLIFLPVWLMYLTVPWKLATSDSATAALMPFTLTQERSFALNSFFGDPEPGSMGLSPGDLKQLREDAVVTVTPTSRGDVEHFYFLRIDGDSFHSIYPLTPGLLNTAVLLLTKLGGYSLRAEPIRVDPGVSAVGKIYPVGTDATLQDYFLEKLSAALFAAISVLLAFRFADRRLSRNGALFFAGFYALGTPHFSISAMGLWQHNFSELFTWLIFEFYDRRSSPDGESIKSEVPAWNYVCAGACIALLAVNRPTNIFPALAFFVLFCLPFKWKNVTPLVAGGALIGSVFISLHLIIYHNLLGGYHGVPLLRPGQTAFSGDFFTGFFGLLISPSRGILILMPLLIAAPFVRSKEKVLSIAAALVILATLLFYAKYPGWHGIWSLGPRFLIDILPWFVILLIPLFSKLSEWNVMRRSLLFMGIGIGVILQLLLVATPFAMSYWHRGRGEEIDRRVWDISYPMFTAAFDPYRLMWKKEADFDERNSERPEPGELKNLSHAIPGFGSLVVSIGPVYVPSGPHCMNADIETKSLEETTTFDLFTGKPSSMPLKLGGLLARAGKETYQFDLQSLTKPGMQQFFVTMNSAHPDRVRVKVGSVRITGACAKL